MVELGVPYLESGHESFLLSRNFERWIMAKDLTGRSLDEKRDHSCCHFLENQVALKGYNIGCVCERER